MVWFGRGWPSIRKSIWQTELRIYGDDQARKSFYSLSLIVIKFTYVTTLCYYFGFVIFWKEYCELWNEWVVYLDHFKDPKFLSEGQFSPNVDIKVNTSLTLYPPKILNHLYKRKKIQAPQRNTLCDVNYILNVVLFA